MKSAVLLLALLGSACTGGGPALHRPDLRLENLAANEAGSNGLFTMYQPKGPARWNQGWPWQLDLSGVAWDSTVTATAIHPRIVVMAAHYLRRPGTAVVFHDRDGRAHPRRIEAVALLKDHGLPCDAAIGLLDQSLPRQIRTYPLPQPGTDPTGRLALVTDQTRSLWFHRIAITQANMLGFRFDPALPRSSRKSLVIGDSGNPSFLLTRGELVLIETHTTGGPGAGPWYGSADLQTALRSAITSLLPGASFRTSSIRPTPNSSFNGTAQD